MSVKIIQTKDDLITEIRDRMIYLLEDDLERNVNLRNVYFYHSDILESSDRTNITCIFIDNDGMLCVDMYRSGLDASMNFICGIRVDSLDEKILKRIIRAFDEGKCTVADYSHDLYEEKNKRLNIVSVFKSVFSQKSA
ncbi:MAG: hypothetical protein FWH53_07240 [Leptospirales bacterium]|nr:hypothetical protein [Leptospirales bacterium]